MPCPLISDLHLTANASVTMHYLADSSIPQERFPPHRSSRTAMPEAKSTTASAHTNVQCNNMITGGRQFQLCIYKILQFASSEA